MIVPMKKLVVFVSSASRDAALKKLRHLGVLHVKPTVAPVSEDLSMLEKHLVQTDKALEMIKSVTTGTPPSQTTEPAEKLVDEILNLHAEKQKINSALEVDRERLRWYSVWGKVTRADLALIRERGIFLRLYTIDKNQAKQIPADKSVQIIAQNKNQMFIALVSEMADEQLDFKEEFVPEEDFALVTGNVATGKQRLTAIADRLNDLSASEKQIRVYRDTLEKQYRWANVRDGMGVAEAIVYLEGYCPEKNLNSFKDLAEKEGWGYLADDPDDPAEVPTLISKPRWLKMVDPIFSFMGTIPGYQEFDVSFWVLAFFSLFFALIVGDAGYGFIFMITAIILRRKNKQASPEIFWLVYILSGALIFWGAITGTWFGFETVARLPLFSSLIVDKVATFSKNPDQVSIFLMYLTFLIGAIHLSIGHILNGIKKINSLQSLAQLGWVGVVWGLFFLVCNLILSDPLPDIALHLIWIGAIMIACFDNYLKGHFWKGIGATIGNLPLSIISSFGDVISYVRLFAVGLAGVAVEDSFNNMALGGGVDNLLKGIIAILIIVFGHSLNIVLCMMSVIVHGIRLNMLEFSGHLGMQWTGQKYEPFRE